MNCTDYLIRTFGSRLHAKVTSEKRPTFLTQADVVEHFVAADPSSGGQFSTWLIACYLRGGFRLEDLSKAKETLTAFSLVKPKLSATSRDVGRYKSLAALWKAVRQFEEERPFEDSETGRALRRKEKMKAHAESMILRDDGGFTIAIPLTVFAAQWWGRGTRWCTSAVTNNYFSDYAHNPLFVIVCELGKFQAFADEGDVQFMDADDADITDATLHFFKQNIPQLTDWLGIESKIAHYVRPELLTYDFVSECLALGNFTIDEVPADFLDEALCLKAVSGDFKALTSVPAGLKTRNVIDTAVESYGHLYHSLPSHLRTKRRLIKSLRTSGSNLSLIPLKQRTRRMCEDAIGGGLKTLEAIPSEHWDNDLALLAAHHCASTVKFLRDALPEKLTADVAFASVKRHRWTVLDLPHELLTRDFCVAIVADFPETYDMLPAAAGTDSVYKEALHQWYLARRKSGDFDEPLGEEIVELKWLHDAKKVRSLKAIFDDRAAAAA